MKFWESTMGGSHGYSLALGSLAAEILYTSNYEVYII